MEVIAGAEKLKSLSDEQKPTVAIITNLLCEKLAVDALIERKTTYIRYKTEGEYRWFKLCYKIVDGKFIFRIFFKVIAFF